MLVEHTFVTTLEKDQALGLAGELLQGLGFRLEPVSGDAVQAVRGRVHPNARKVVLLPQGVRLVYDRGRVNVAAAITPRAGDGGPVHADLMTAIVLALEHVLVSAWPLDQAAGEVRLAELRAGSVWTTGDKLAVGCLVVVGLGVAISVMFAVLAIVLAG